MLLGWQILQSVLAEVPNGNPSGQVVFNQSPRGIGENHLAAVGRGADSRSPVNVEPDVVAGDNATLARVNPDPHPELDPSGPAPSRNPQLGIDGGGDRCLCVLEHDKEGIALGA